MKRLHQFSMFLLALAVCLAGQADKGQAAGITFAVCDVTQATQRLRNIDYREAVERRIGEFEAGSHADRRLVQTHANALLEATFLSFSWHYPLVLTPDMIWLAICQGFGDPRNPWQEVEKAAFEVAFMDALDSYFTHELIIMCGVPQITLLGTPEDWELIRDNAQKLRHYDLDWWIDALIPVLDQFVDASRGNIDKEFWGRIYNRENLSGEPRVSGWILRLFPYLPGGSSGPQRNPFVQRDPGPREGIAIDDFASGISLADFLLIDFTQAPPDTFPMEFLAGFVGGVQDSVTLGLRPEIGWLVRDDPDPQTC